jgi:hypothetical protein
VALGIYFVHEEFTPEKYDSAIKKLEAAGAGKPKGRTYHCALESNGEIQVFDIWKSEQDFDAFGTTLMPILTELGVGLGADGGDCSQRDCWLGPRRRWREECPAYSACGGNSTIRKRSQSAN